MHPKGEDQQEPMGYVGVEQRNEMQDDGADDPAPAVGLAGLGFARIEGKITPVDKTVALRWYRDAITDPPFDPTGMCQRCARESYRVEALNGSAWTQYLTTSPEHRHNTSNFDEVPVGALMITKGANPAGHIFEAANPFSSGVPAGLSNDIVRTGHINFCSRNAPRDHWGHRNIAWIMEVNGFVLDLTHARKPPRPLENKRYKRIERSIEMLREVRDAERKDHDLREARLVQREIDRLKELYSKVKHT